MKVTTEEFDNCEVLMTVEIDDKQKKRLLEKAARRISRQVRIPGFRPGKAPYRFIVNKFGLEAIQNEAMEDLTNDIFRQAIDEADITPYAQASLDEVEWEPLTMKVKVPTEPVVKLGNYREIRIEFEEPEVTEEEINEELKRLQDQQATYETVNRPAQLQDLVSVTTSEKDIESGEMVEQERDYDLTILDPDEEPKTPDVGTAIIGLSAEEQKIFTHTYPADYGREEFAGKTVEVFVHVNEVKEKEILELDDDFAGLVGDYETLEDLKESVTENIASQKQYDVDRELMPKVIDAVMAGVELIKWPLSLENQELDNVVEQRKREASQQGMDWQTYLQTQQLTEEELRKSLKDDVQDSLKQSLVLSKVIELEELQIDPDELRQQAEFMVMLSGGSPEAAESFRSPAGLQFLANNMLFEQARGHLLRIAKGEVEMAEAEAAEEDATLVTAGEVIDGQASDVVGTMPIEEASAADQDAAIDGNSEPEVVVTDEGDFEEATSPETSPKAGANL